MTKPIANVAAVAAVALAATGCTAGDHGDPYGVAAAPPLPVAAPAADFEPGPELADHDASVLATVDDGQLIVRPGTGGLPLASLPVTAGAELRAVSADGSRFALWQPLDGSSRITTVDRGADGVTSTATYTLDGLIEPEAFSTDGRRLFVIDHEVADVPGAYRVRPLDLESGELQTILGPRKLPFTDDMNGVGRRQVWSPDGTRLYTLYIRQTHHHHGDGSTHGHGQAGTDGFVHVLDLSEEWAFCLDLPSAFGTGELATTALAVSPDGDEIAVADLTAGEIAYASTGDLAVTGTAALPALAPDGELHLGLSLDHVALGWGDEVHWFDAATMARSSAEPDRLDGPLIGFTSLRQELLAWIGGVELGPTALTPPS